MQSIQPINSINPRRASNPTHPKTTASFTKQNAASEFAKSISIYRHTAIYSAIATSTLQYTKNQKHYTATTRARRTWARCCFHSHRSTSASIQLDHSVNPVSQATQSIQSMQSIQFIHSMQLIHAVYPGIALSRSDQSTPSFQFGQRSLFNHSIPINPSNEGSRSMESTWPIHSIRPTWEKTAIALPHSQQTDMKGTPSTLPCTHKAGILRPATGAHNT